MSEKIVQLNEEIIKQELRELVRSSAEEALIEICTLLGYRYTAWRISQRRCGAARCRRLSAS